MIMNKQLRLSALAFQALSDPTRLRLLSLAASGAPCANDLNRALNMSQPRVARHLKILVEAGLLEADRDGRFVRYRLTESDWGRRLVGLALESAGNGLAADPPTRGGQTGLSSSVTPGAQPDATSDVDDESHPTPPLEDFLL